MGNTALIGAYNMKAINECPIMDELIDDEIQESEVLVKLACFFDKVWERLDDIEPTIEDYYNF